MNLLSHTAKAVLCSLILIAVSGCEKTDKEAPYKTPVDYPKIPPLQAGVSISQSLAASSQTNDSQQQQTVTAAAIANANANSTSNNVEPTVELTPVEPQKNAVAKSKTNPVQESGIKADDKKPTKTTLVLNNNISKNSPIATLKTAMDIIYIGDARQAAKYYETKTDISKLLVETQQAFQQSIESVRFTDTEYNKDKTEAKVFSEIIGKSGQKQQTVFFMKKFDDGWKILEK